MVLTLQAPRSLLILTSLSFPSSQKKQVLSTSQPASSPHHRARAAGMQGCCAYIYSAIEDRPWCWSIFSITMSL